MKKKIIAVITIAFLAITGTATGASALTSSRACTVNGYAATNMIDYQLSGTDWMIYYITYQYSPYNALSTHNNLNERMYNSSGTMLYSYNSMDNLIRDGEMYSAHYFTNPLKFSIGYKLQLINIIDVPNASDPQCTTTFQR